MRICGKLMRTGLLIIVIPLLSQLAFSALIWHLWHQSPGAPADAVQRKVIFGSITYFILMAATLFFFYMDAVASDPLRLKENIRKISEGDSTTLEDIKIEELSTVQKSFQELEKALKHAVVAAHEGKESKVSEMKLRLHEERVRLIVNTMPVGLVVLDTRGNIESHNPAAQRMFSLDLRESKSFSSLFAGTTSGALDLLDELAALSPTKPREMTARRTNGTEFPVELTVQSFEAIEGNRHLALLLDVTERHEVERLKQEFVAMVSHELRTPLTSVSAFLEMLSMGTFDGDLVAMKSRSEVANRNVTRLVGLVNNLLDLEKMQAGRFEFRVKQTSATSVLQRSIESVSEFALQHGVAIHSTVSDTTFDGDEERLIQVIINLLSNAIKFSNPGETVFVSVKDSDRFLEFSVEDGGPGVPAGAEGIIFEKYRQALQPGINRPKGTGLGLPLCKTIVEQHGGSIGVDTGRERGSRFWFRIPKAVDPSLMKAAK